MRKFLKLTLASDNTTTIINSDLIVQILREEDDEYTTIIMSDEYSDIEVDETPSKIYAQLTGAIALKQKEVQLPNVAPAVVPAGPTIVTSEPNWDHHS